VRISVLDHGYVEAVEFMGTDSFLAECARMSTNTVASEDANQRLVQRLIRDRHTSPIEFGQIVVEVVMPIFVMRQWVRHRTGAFNEFSGRYSVFPDLYYVPELERIQYQSTFNKQGSADPLPEDEALGFQNMIKGASVMAYDAYTTMVEAGVTRELARIVLPTNFYTKVRWTVNLHNLFHFLKLREDPHAQWEVRQYAAAMHEIAREYFPVATKAFEDHIQNAVTMSSDTATRLAFLAQSALVLAKNPELPSELRDFIHRHGVDYEGRETNA